MSQHFDWYDENGALQSSLWLVAGTGSMTGLQKKEDLTFSYRGLPSTYTIATAGGSRTWEYRYNAIGEREQKRVLENCADTVHAGEHNYTHTNPGIPQPWTYYHLGVDGSQLGVWHGSRTCKESCIIGGIFDLLYYPAEYTGYGLLGGEVTVYPDGQKRYNVKDNLGSTRCGVMPLDSAMNRTHYLPFGTEAVTGVPTREAYIDKEKDVEDGTNNFGVREYRTGDGRFISVDPLWAISPGWSPYVYSRNSPVGLKDPTGLYEEGDDDCGCIESVEPCHKDDENSGSTNWGPMGSSAVEGIGLSWYGAFRAGGIGSIGSATGGTYLAYLRSGGKLYSVSQAGTVNHLPDATGIAERDRGVAGDIDNTINSISGMALG